MARPTPPPLRPQSLPAGYSATGQGGYPNDGYTQDGFTQDGYTHDDRPRPGGYPATAQPEKSEKPSSRWSRDEDRPARGNNKREDAAFKKATYLVKLDGEGMFDAEGTAIPPVIGG